MCYHASFIYEFSLIICGVLKTGNTSKFKPLPDIEKKICWRMTAIRRLNNLSQGELAKRAGITRNQLANVEAMRVPLKFGVAMEVCRLLRLNPQWLYSGEGKETLFLDFKDWIFSRLLTHRQASESFSAAWKAIGEDLLYFGNTIDRKLENQGREGQSVKDLLESHSGPLVVEMENRREEKASKGKTPIDDIPKRGNNEVVKARLPELLKRLNAATQERGKKAALARFLKVPLPKVSQWLSGTHSPGGETTLQLLQWVEQEERQ
ncbi:MAG TPA: helix-turn-helix transcriptional regulator [Verrucomicrobiae bacterium]|jgi:transcriptional regulator with XRE-family HTH domain|nr:helix-turn-helix transcriptional regulator [Verrucomicrobiae bacterium]